MLTHKWCPDHSHQGMMEFGAAQGWWEEWDDIGPIRLWFVDFEKFKGGYLSQVFTTLGLFESVRKAKEAGWNQPVKTGMFLLRKGREKIIIE